MSKENIKSLIWYTSYGEYTQDTDKSIHSLVTNGYYDGDIIILSDRLGNNRINVWSDLCRKYKVKTLSKRKIWCSKAEIGNYVDLNKYDICMYIDSDVVVCRDINPILSLVHKSGHLMVQHNACMDIKSGGESQGEMILTKGQKDKYGDLSICAGILAFPAKSYGNKFLLEWSQEHSKFNYRINDQATLTKLIIEKYVNSFGYIPGAEWHYSKTGKSDNKNATLIHCGFKRFGEVYLEHCREKS